MNCPSCGYDNKPDALTCNLCQAILRREKPLPSTPRERPPSATPPPAAPTFSTVPRARPPFPLAAIFFGLALFFLGGHLSCRQYRRASFPEYPRNMTPTEMLAHSGFAYTRFDRNQVLRDQAVFKKSSQFLAVDPRVGFETANAKDILSSRTKLMGTYVRFTNAVPFLQYFTLISKRIHYTNGHAVHEETLGHRVFAPVLGANGALWIVSPYSQTEPKVEPFIAAGTYSGTLMPLKELLDNENFAKLQHAYSSGPNSVNESAVAIVEGPAPTGADVSAWYPLGPAHDLFVEVPDDADLDLDYAEGVLDEPLSSSARSALQAALDKRGAPKVTLPKTVRAIVLTKPDDFKEARRIGEKFDRYYFGILATGAVLLAIAGLRIKQIFGA